MSIYCVYVTFYRGNKLPPFYIGSTSIKRISNGYRGSVASKEFKEIWKSELIENGDLFDTRILCTFDDRISARAKEDKIHRALNVIENTLYTNKAFASGCFGATTTGRKQTEETKRKIGIKSLNKKTKRRTVESKATQSTIMKAKIAAINAEGRDYAKRLCGEDNPMHGKTPTNAIISYYDGIEFPSVKAMNEYRREEEFNQKGRKIESEFNGIVFRSKKEMNQYKKDTGINNRSKPISINGVNYKSKRSAMIELKLTQKKLDILIKLNDSEMLEYQF